MEKYSNDEEQSINELCAEENKCGNRGESGAQQILINSVDFTITVMGEPSYVLQLLTSFCSQ